MMSERKKIWIKSSGNEKGKKKMKNWLNEKKSKVTERNRETPDRLNNN